MQQQQPESFGNPVLVLSVFLTAVAMKYGFTSDPQWYKLAYISIPLMICSIVIPRLKPSRN
jgi:uncharacterized membrane protein YhdT